MTEADWLAAAADLHLGGTPDESWSTAASLKLYL
jgi:hypothetical protein